MEIRLHDGRRVAGMRVGAVEARGGGHGMGHGARSTTSRSRGSRVIVSKKNTQRHYGHHVTFPAACMHTCAFGRPQPGWRLRVFLCVIRKENDSR